MEIQPKTPLEGEKISLGSNIDSGQVVGSFNPQQNQTPVEQVKKKDFSKIAIIGAIVIVILITIVAVWLILSYQPKNSSVVTPPVSPALNEKTSTTSSQPKVQEELDAQTNTLKTVGTSIDVTEIEKDVNNTDLNNIDSEIKEIESASTAF